MQQGRGRDASDLAAKSLALAGADKDLKANNWKLMAKARRSMGDAEGASTAERKARMLYY